MAHHLDVVPRVVDEAEGQPVERLQQGDLLGEGGDDRPQLLAEAGWL
jgi:hypothetical protein